MTSTPSEEFTYQHTSVDAYGCNPLVVKNEAAVGDFSNRVCDLIGAKPLSKPLVASFGGQVEKIDPRIYGPSSYQITDGGVVVCHFPVETGLVCVDAEHEQPFDSEAVARLTADFFGANRQQLVGLLRGRPHEAPTILAIRDSTRAKIRWALKYYAYIDRNAPGRSSVTMKHLLQSFNPDHDWGQVTNVDLHGCDLEKTQSDESLRHIIREICTHVGARPYGDTCITRIGNETKATRIHVYQLIEVSGISTHIIPHLRKAFVTAFSCRAFDSKKLVKKLHEIFQEENYITQTILRGAPAKFPEIYHSTDSANLDERWRFVHERG